VLLRSALRDLLGEDAGLAEIPYRLYRRAAPMTGDDRNKQAVFITMRTLLPVFWRSGGR